MMDRSILKRRLVARRVRKHGTHDQSTHGNWSTGAKATVDPYWGQGGCGHFGIALQQMVPGLKLAVEWDDGDQTVNHVVAYDPKTGKAYDYLGEHDSVWVAMPSFSGSSIEEDVTASAIADSMGFDWDSNEPWANATTFEAATVLQEEWGL